MAWADSAPQATRITAWVSIGTDGTVTLLSGSQDMGQGIYSALAQILAEELRCDWTQVQAGPAPVNPIYANPLLGGQFTAASSSVQGFFAALLEAGAIARTLLIEAGAAAMDVRPDACLAESGSVVVRATGQSVTFASVAAAASRRLPPASAPLYSAKGYTLVGQPVQRTDIPAKVNGTAVYGSDVVVPRMRYGAVLLCPTRGGRVATMGPAPTGCQVVDLGTGICAVADAGPNNTTWAAMQAVQQVKVTWTQPETAGAQSSPLILSEAETLLAKGIPVIAENIGNVGKAQAGAARVLTLTYYLPYLPHATLEPPNCTASVTAERCDIWAPTQATAAAQAAAASLTGLPLSAVTVHCMAMGGGLGRKLETDFVSYAVLASKKLGVPVQVMFPRAQDFTQDQYRPMALCRVVIGLAKDGSVASWDYRNVSPSILLQRKAIAVGQLDSQATEGATGLSYAFPSRRTEWVRHGATIPVGFWRSVGHSINAFAVESAIDEAAYAGKTDPLAYRQALLAGNTRALAVLSAAAAMGGWGTTRPGTANGLAYHESFGSIAAAVVSVSESNGAIVLVNVACAVDCGLVVNPDTAAQQVEGAIVQGLTAALWGQIKFAKGVAQSSNFDTYRMMRMADMPPVEVQFLQSAGAAPSGLGEVALPLMAPAVANAWAKLTGQRLRALPLFPVA
jgi:isoquinoline 1-oxidoreductase beta subunit